MCTNKQKISLSHRFLLETHFWSCPNKKISENFFANLHQYAKNQAVSSICSGVMVDSKILQSDWLRAFWPISSDQDFSQIRDLCRNTTNSKNRWKRKSFSKKSANVTNNNFLAPCQNSEKLMIHFQESAQMEKQENGWKERFHNLEKLSGYCQGSKTYSYSRPVD